MTGEVVAHIQRARKAAQESWDPLKRLATTFGHVPDDEFHSHVVQVARAMDALDRYFDILLREARRRGIG